MLSIPLVSQHTAGPSAETGAVNLDSTEPVVFRHITGQGASALTTRSRSPPGAAAVAEPAGIQY